MHNLKKILNFSLEYFLVKFAIVIFLIVLLFPYYKISMDASAGIDNSWKIGLEIARQKGFVFGRDIIFTYGPLGYWIYHYAVFTTNFEFFLIDFFIFLNICFLLYFWLPKPLNIYRFWFFFTIFFVISTIGGEWVHFMLFFPVIFFGFYYLKSPQIGLAVYLIAMGILNFFIKANFGIIALVFITSLFLYAALTKKYAIKTYFLLMVLSIVLLIFISYFLKTDLLNYTISSFQIISGYNETMAVFPESKLKILLSSFAIFMLIGITLVGQILKISTSKNRNTKEADTTFLLFWVGIISFVLFKYAFVRAEEGHILSFVKLVFLPILLVPTFCHNMYIKYIFWAIFVLNLITYLAFYQPKLGKFYLDLEHNAQIIKNNLAAKSEILPKYFKDITKDNKVPTPTFPKEILETIGNKSVDVIPTEISDIYFNHLNYNPRPVFQSYQAYNTYLDQKNKTKYLSATAPEFIIYSLESIDGKYPMGDETQTLLAILERYSVVKSWDSKLLLRKNVLNKTLKLVKTTLEKQKINQEFSVKNEGNLLHIACLKVKYNWFGQVMKFIFQPPSLALALSTSSSTKTYKTAPTLLSKGLYLNNRIDNLNQAKQLIDRQTIDNQQIIKMLLKENLKGMTGFEEDFEIEHQYYSFE